LKNASIKASWPGRIIVNKARVLERWPDFFLPMPFSAIFNVNLSLDPGQGLAFNLRHSNIWYSIWLNWLNLRNWKPSEYCRANILWFNSLIRVQGVPCYYTSWIEKGIWTIEHLWNHENNCFLTFEEFQNEYGPFTSYLHFYGLLSAIPKELLGGGPFGHQGTMDLLTSGPMKTSTSVKQIYWSAPQWKDNFTSCLLRKWTDEVSDLDVLTGQLVCLNTLSQKI